MAESEELSAVKASRELPEDSPAPASAFNREQRCICHAARDAYFKCTKYNIQDNGEMVECRELRNTFEQSCPAKWFHLFIENRRKVYEEWNRTRGKTVNPLTIKEYKKYERLYNE